MDQESRALRKAAIELSTKMLVALNEAERAGLVDCVTGGGLLVLELGPLPDCSRIAMVMVEREGARRVVCALDAR